MNDLVALREGRAWTTSLKVAEAFGLDHGVLVSDFLAKSHRLSVGFMQKNFKGCEGLGPLAYSMTRDGFHVFRSDLGEGQEEGWNWVVLDFILAFDEAEQQLIDRKAH